MITTHPPKVSVESSLSCFFSMKEYHAFILFYQECVYLIISCREFRPQIMFYSPKHEFELLVWEISDSSLVGGYDSYIYSM